MVTVPHGNTLFAVKVLESGAFSFRGIGHWDIVVFLLSLFIVETRGVKLSVFFEYLLLALGQG